METILLHHCCSTCSPSVVELLSKDFNIKSFWFNPNIYPHDEYDKRKKSFEKLADILKLSIEYGTEYSYGEWKEKMDNVIPECLTDCVIIMFFRLLVSFPRKWESILVDKIFLDYRVKPPRFRHSGTGFNDIMTQSVNRESRSDDRCRQCYIIRLTETANTAQKLGIKYFSTTLLSSPHQKHNLIKSVGDEIAKEHNLTFVYRDFRPFFYEGKNKAYKLGLYMQKYCGCHYSAEL